MRKRTSFALTKTLTKVVEDHQESTKEEIEKTLVEQDKNNMDTKGNRSNLISYQQERFSRFSSYRHFFSNGGQCDVASKIMTSILVAICGFSCFILSFTDSYKDKNGTICYGLATTLHGFWIIDDRQRFLKSYLKNIKFCSCFRSLLVFGAVFYSIEMRGSFGDSHGVADRIGALAFDSGMSLMAEGLIAASG
ncbi:hypothetical protein HID58_077872 [Brassica napus]|uniref:CASP-like protein n=1 Tax=Brassica napus TaxID=3708 RepID=A0ABQ7YRK1_BRANA|nr:hypothetical protein HID58_077872 [Brassica napus]